MALFLIAYPWMPAFTSCALFCLGCLAACRALHAAMPPDEDQDLADRW